MVILTDTSSAQDITVIPRYKPIGNVRVTLRSESKNKVTHTLIITPTYSNGYLTMTNSYSPALKLNTFYELKVDADNSPSFDQIYRGKVFVTDQIDLPVYTINEGEFTEFQGNDNEFLSL